MNLSQFKKQLDEICRENNIKMLGVFGSVARGEDTPESDIDLLVQFSEIPDLIQLIKLEERFVKVLGKKVDLVTEGFLHPLIKENALKDLRVLYETT
ncbi:MAG: nucleotidyltransferase family protein [Pyrinomonadaceae bacterium]